MAGRDPRRRDRSWGIRSSGDPDPAGRRADEPREGHYWAYVPLRFEDHMMILIAQEDPDVFRTLNTAVRVDVDGRVEQLGWPRFEITYASGTRVPLGATITTVTPRGEVLVVECELFTQMNLSHGCGYMGDPDGVHGQWHGRGWSTSVDYDVTSQDFLTMLSFSTVEHVCRARINGTQIGWGMFEHVNVGRHAPSDFAGYSDMAP